MTDYLIGWAGVAVIVTTVMLNITGRIPTDRRYYEWQLSGDLLMIVHNWLERSPGWAAVWIVILVGNVWLRSRQPPDDDPPGGGKDQARAKVAWRRFLPSPIPAPGAV